MKTNELKKELVSLEVQKQMLMKMVRKYRTEIREDQLKYYTISDMKEVLGGLVTF